MGTYNGTDKYIADESLVMEDSKTVPTGATEVEGDDIVDCKARGIAGVPVEVMFEIAGADTVLAASASLELKVYGSEDNGSNYVVVGSRTLVDTGGADFDVAGPWPVSMNFCPEVVKAAILGTAANGITADFAVRIAPRL